MCGSICCVSFASLDVVCDEFNYPILSPTHPQHLPPRPSQTHTHVTYTFTTLISSTSPALVKYMNHMYHPYTHSPQPHRPRTPHHHCCNPRTLTVLQQTHKQHRQQYMHHSHRKNGTHNIGYLDNLTDRPMTTTGQQTPHKHTDSAVKVGEIILQVNINGIKNKLTELKLLIHDTHADIITIQETNLIPKANTPKVPNFTTVRAVRLYKAQGSTRLQPSIHTTQNFKWSRYTLTTPNISQLQTFIYHLETAHPHTTKQLTQTYNTEYSTSQTYHTQSSPEM